LRQFRRYLKLFMSDWLAIMSGSASVPATILGVFGRSPAVQLGFGSFAVFCWLLCGFRIWQKSQPNFAREREQAVRSEFLRLSIMSKAGLRYILVRGEVEESQVQRYLEGEQFEVPASLWSDLCTDVNFLQRTTVGRWSINPIHRNVLEELFSEPPSSD
jgi:hypothetical protein